PGSHPAGGRLHPARIVSGRGSAPRSSATPDAAQWTTARHCSGAGRTRKRDSNASGHPASNLRRGEFVNGTVLDVVLRILAVAVLVLLNGFFVAAEFAFVK